MVSLLFTFTVSAQEEIGSGGIGGRPGIPREDNPRSESIFIHILEPGQSVEDGINIINNDAETRTIAVYATDSVISSGGAFACEQKVESDDDVGSWVSLSKSTVTLKSAGSELVPFSILVPENTDVGEHNGCIVVQEIQPESNPESGIGLSFRTAIRLAVLVPGEIDKKLEIVSLSSSVQEEKVVATTEVENSGNVSIDSDISTTLDYFFGRQYSESGGQFPVLRGQTGEWNFEHSRPFWGGWYRVGVSATYDPNPDNFLGEEGTELTELGFPSFWIFIWPQPLALAIEGFITLLIGFIIYLIIKRLRIKRAVATKWKSYTVKSGADIKSIAKKCGISWRSLARANKLKAPYILEAGQKLKVPIPPKKKDD